VRRLMLKIEKVLLISSTNKHFLAKVVRFKI
jgi:hypothetical protein